MIRFSVRNQQGNGAAETAQEVVGSPTAQSAPKASTQGQVVHVTDANFQREVVEHKGPVVIDLWAPWCGPCRALGPTIDQLAARNPDLKVVKINVDEAQGVARALGVRGIPDVRLVLDGKIANIAMGAQPLAALETTIRRVLQSCA